MSFGYANKLAALGVHLFTASGAVVGLIAVNAIYQHQFVTAFWLMGLTIFIDAIDGTFARLFRVKKELPKVDGTLLDNIVDYFNYVMVPAFFLLINGLLPEAWRLFGAGIIVLASAYQFCQIDAKTSDHFFKGFPSYWNIVVFYLFIWSAPPLINLAIIITLTLLIFVPIKYVYPSRLEYLSNNRFLCRTMLSVTILWGVATLALLWIYPKTNVFLTIATGTYMAIYFIISLYRTWVVLPMHEDQNLS